MKAAELSEHESWGGLALAAAEDVVDIFRSREPPLTAASDLVYKLAIDLLSSSPPRYIEVFVPTAPGASNPITATFLVDEFREDLAGAADKLLAME